MCRNATHPDHVYHFCTSRCWILHPAACLGNSPQLLSLKQAQPSVWTQPASARAARRLCLHTGPGSLKCRLKNHKVTDFPFQTAVPNIRCLVWLLSLTHFYSPHPHNPGSSSAGIPSEGLAGPGVPTVVNTNPA